MMKSYTLDTIYSEVSYYELVIRFSLAGIAISIKHIVISYSGNARKC